MEHIGQVTYDKEVEMGYIYFCEPSTYKITHTEELPGNDDIMYHVRFWRRGSDCWNRVRRGNGKKS